MLTKPIRKKVISQWRPQIRSRHATHDVLRGALPLNSYPSVIRLGSTTDLPDTSSNGGRRIEINTIQAINCSSNKLLMKRKFAENNVKTAEWVQSTDQQELLKFFKNHEKTGVVSKSLYGSRGTGNTLITTLEDFTKFIKNNKLSNFIFEKYYDYSREYRLHITEEGYFYSCRKLLKEETPKEQRWYRNDSNCTWILENNKSFNKPHNWEDIIAESVKALEAVGLDIGAVDVKVQTDKKGERKNQDFIIIEINSAPSFGNITAEKYKEILPKLLNLKYKEYNGK